MTAQLNDALEDIDILNAEKEELQKEADELKSLVVQREEDVSRAKERMETAVSELDSKLNSEVRTKFVYFTLLRVTELISIIGTLSVPRLIRWNKMLDMRRSSSQNSRARPRITHR